MTTHPLSIGTIVDVVNTSLSGRQVVEGRATIVSPYKSREHTYIVRFHSDDHMTYQRFVLPEQKVKVSGPRVGKYGKAVVAKSLDPAFKKFAVVRPYTGTAWFDTEAEAVQVCENYNAVEIPDMTTNEPLIED